MCVKKIQFEYAIINDYGLTHRSFADKLTVNACGLTLDKK
jgi:hypothetical protein